MNAKMQPSRGLTGEALLNLLLDRFEAPRARARDITQTIDYTRIGGLSNEIQQKLIRHRPETIGQASRIQGMTPAAISILLVHLKRGALAAARSNA